MDYGALLKRGWNITWNNKWLWILGFLAALGGSGGSGSSGSGNFNSNGSGGFGSGEIDPDTARRFEEIGRMFENPDFLAQIGAIAAIAICCLVLFGIIMWFVRLVAEAGLIQGVANIEDGLKTDFRQSFSAGSQYLGKFFVLKLVLWAIPLIVGIIAAVIVLTTVGAAIANDGSPEALGGIFLCIFPLVCLLIPYNIIVSLLYPIAQREIVLQGLAPVDSIKSAWDFLKKNVGEVLIIGLIFVAIGIGFGIVAAIVTVPIILAAGAPAGIAFFMNGTMPSSGLIVLAVFGVIAAMILGSIVQSVMITFRSSTFTLAYRELKAGGKAKTVTAVPEDPFDMP